VALTRFIAFDSEYCCARIGFPALSRVVDVVIKADLMAAGLQCGCFCFRRAAIPAICGAAILVPDIMANPSPAQAQTA